MNNHLQLKSIGVKFMKIFLEYDKKIIFSIYETKF